MVINQLERVVDLFANIDRGNLLMRAPAELKQVAYQFSHPVDFGGHNSHGMKFLFILAKLHGERLQSQGNCREWIIEFVRHAGRQLADSGQLRRLP